jgi:hypothetical protein
MKDIINAQNLLAATGMDDYYLVKQCRVFGACCFGFEVAYELGRF